MTINSATFKITNCSVIQLEMKIIQNISNLTAIIQLKALKFRTIFRGGCFWGTGLLSSQKHALSPQCSFQPYSSEEYGLFICQSVCTSCQCITYIFFLQTRKKPVFLGRRSKPLNTNQLIVSLFSIFYLLQPHCFILAFKLNLSNELLLSVTDLQKTD